VASDKDYVSRVIAVTSFVISVATFYLTLLDKRYDLLVSTEDRPAEMHYGPSPSFKLNTQQFSFLNRGSQPISIQGVSYTPMVLGDKPDDSCKDEYQRERYQEGSLLAASKIYLGAIPKDFIPFTVKPGELEPRTYAFEVSFHPTALETPDPKATKKYLVVCMEIDYFTDATGRGQRRLLVASVDLEKRLPDWVTMKALDLELIKKRWPFYLIDANNTKP
jgi:hypothetical protein